MRRKRDDAAHALGIEASFIAPRAAIEAIVAGHKSPEQLLVPWQRELLALST
jgi:hypothetical protein